MEKKSKKSIKAANFLETKKFYSSGVHCLYYAVYQKMISVLSISYSYKEQRNLFKGENSHNKFIKEICLLIKQEQRDSFKNGVDFLKRMRCKADYNDKDINKQTYSKCKDITLMILNILTNDI